MPMRLGVAWVSYFPIFLPTLAVVLLLSPQLVSGRDHPGQYSSADAALSINTNHLKYQEHLGAFRESLAARDSIRASEIRYVTRFEGGSRFGRVEFLGDDWNQVSSSLRVSGLPHSVVALSWEEEYARGALELASLGVGVYGSIGTVSGVLSGAGAGVSLVLTLLDWYESGVGWIPHEQASRLFGEVERVVGDYEVASAKKAQTIYCSRIYPNHSMLFVWVHDWSGDPSILQGDRREVVALVSHLTAGEPLPDPMYVDQYALVESLCAKS